MTFMPKFLLILLAVCSRLVSASPLPRFIPGEYLNDEFLMMNRAQEAPAVDGDLSDACWKGAVELYPFSTLGGGGALSLLQTKVKVCWDEMGFYVAYHCIQPDMELARRRGDHLEIFWMPLYPDKPPHFNHATSLLMMAHGRPEEFHYQQGYGGMGGRGGLYFRNDTGVKSAGRTGDDWWTWEAFFPYKALTVHGLPPPDSKVAYWRIGFNRWSNFHGEIGWFGSMISSLNHQANHCPIFQLVKDREAPTVRLTHPLKGQAPGRFSVTVTNHGKLEKTYEVKVLLRNEPFDPTRKAMPDNQVADVFALKKGEQRSLDFRVPYQGWRNQYRVEVWGEPQKKNRKLYYRGLWYSLGEPLTHGWDAGIPSLGIIPEPREVSLEKGVFSLSGEIKVIAEPGASEDIYAAEFLGKPIGSLSNTWPSFKIMAKRMAEPPRERFIALGEPDKSPLVRKLLRKASLEDRLHVLNSQGYVLVIGRKSILIAGRSPAGTFYGVQTLRQLIVRNSGALQALTIVDWPDLDWRGAWHSFRVTPANIDLACLFKLNFGDLSLHEKKKHHFRPLSFNAHTWFGHTGGALVPPEKREPSSGREAIICPASECREELTARLDTSIRALGIHSADMDMVFVGADEASFGLDERCRKMINEKGAGWTVAHHFRDNMLAACRARGKRMACWADALLSFEDSLNYMPKDFHPVHWMYYPSAYSGGVDVLGKHKLPFVVSPMTRGENSFHFPQIWSREYNIATLARCAAHEKGKGIWLTTWGGGLDDDLLWYSYLLAAEYGWSPGPDLQSFRRKFGRMFYGSERAVDWLVGLERMTSLYLSKRKQDEKPSTFSDDSQKLSQMQKEMKEVINRKWYTSDKLETLLKVAREVSEAMDDF